MFNVNAISAFNDNYIWCISNTDTQEAWIVDPGDASPVVAHLERERLTLRGILITHHHGDHVGGVSRLLKQWDVPVYGPRTTPYGGVTQPLDEGDTLELPGMTFQILAVPGHTLDHIAFYCSALGDTPALFCGDTLFACGCGRLFEGRPEQMQQSLAKLIALPDATRVYCAHEYTLANLRFARAVLPNDAALQAFETTCEKRRESGKPTLPVTLGNEKQLNPFLRWGDNALIQSAMEYAGNQGLELSPDQPASVFAIIRRWKDHF